MGLFSLHPVLLLLLLLQTVLAMNLADVPCGKSDKMSRAKHGRIVGGKSVPITDFPHAVEFRRDGVHHCGGSLIHKDFVLTAAHCFRDNVTVSVIIGEERTEQPVASVLKHPSYESSTNHYDLALVRLGKSVLWSEHTQPICLPDSGGDKVEGKTGYLTGWGLDGEMKKGGSFTKDLHAVSLPIMENELCQEWLRDSHVHRKLMPEHLCAGHEQGGQDGCQGDSGGGLVTGEEQLMLVGVMSMGVGCGREKSPGIYTRVERFTEWVRMEVEKAARKKREAAAVMPPMRPRWWKN